MNRSSGRNAYQALATARTTAAIINRLRVNMGLVSEEGYLAPSATAPNRIDDPRLINGQTSDVLAGRQNQRRFPGRQFDEHAIGADAKDCNLALCRTDSIKEVTVLADREVLCVRIGAGAAARARSHER